MGLTLPTPDNPREQARTLITQKENIEAELDAQLSVLKANSCTLHSPLVDADGFPRADVDIYAVRSARIRIIELRNDLDAVVNAIAKALEGVYDVGVTHSISDEASASAAVETQTTTTKPFARVDGVAPGSPAADAVRAHTPEVTVSLKFHIYRDCRGKI